MDVARTYALQVSCHGVVGLSAFCPLLVRFSYTKIRSYLLFSDPRTPFFAFRACKDRTPEANSRKIRRSPFGKKRTESDL